MHIKCYIVLSVNVLGNLSFFKIKLSKCIVRFNYTLKSKNVHFCHVLFFYFCKGKNTIQVSKK